MQRGQTARPARMTDPAGKLHIRIGPDSAAIRSTRPVRASALFVGRSIEETARLLPALFSICATAQSAACAGALERAWGLGPDPLRDCEVAALRHRLVQAETLREHLWRILLDWPRLQGEEPDSAAMAQAMRLHRVLKAALTAGGDPLRPGAGEVRANRPAGERASAGLALLIGERVLGCPPADWLGRIDGVMALGEWSVRTDTAAARLIRRIFERDRGDLGRCAIAALPALTDAELDDCLSGPGADAFVARPSWQDTPRETSPLTRNLDAGPVAALAARFGNGLLTRIVAVLVELARLAADPDGPHPQSAGPAQPPLGPGLGLAQIQAARGLLVHRVQIVAGRVADYRILAPTEWSFHPQGSVAAGLADLAARSPTAELLPLARLFVAAVDPCVDFDLELVGPGDVRD